MSFVASRAAPSGGFWVALAGGVAVARAAQRHGAREGHGVSAAAMIESIALMGPARAGIPLTQALSAPLLGRLEARGAPFWRQYAACLAIRLAQNSLGTAFAIWIVLGGLDAYAGTYDALLGRLPLLPDGASAALAATGVGLLAWGLFASWIQVRVYMRALRRWPQPGPAPAPSEAEEPPPAPERRLRFDPRAVTLAAGVAFALLLASTAWVVLAAVALWLAVAAATSRPEYDPVPAGLALAALLAAGALTFGLVGGLGIDVAGRRAVRAGLLVLVATWLRAASGAEGLRLVSRRGLARLPWLPSAREAAGALDRLGPERGLLASGRSLVDSLRDTKKRPLPVLDAVLAWVGDQTARFSPAPVPAGERLRARAADALLVVLAAAPALALLAA